MPAHGNHFLYHGILPLNRNGKKGAERNPNVCSGYDHGVTVEK